MGMFDKINEAKVMEGGIYVLPGVYRVKLQVCKATQTRKGIDMIAVEMRILESSNPERPVGSDMSWVLTADKDAFKSNVKQFLMGVMGLKDTEVDEAGAKMVFSEANPLGVRATLARISATNVTTKKGTPFTRVKWIHDSAGADAAQKAHQSQSTVADPAEETAAAAAPTG